MFTEPAHYAHTPDLWPCSSLTTWQLNPVTAFAEWLTMQHVVGTRQFRETSRETYTAIFSTWLQFLQKSGMHLLEAAPNDATQFFSQQCLEPVSRRRYLQLLDKVYKHLLLLGWNHSNPMQRELAKERVLDVAWPQGLDLTDLN